MELKNAGFDNTEESRREAMKRMIDGEVFVIREWRIYLSPKYQKFVALHKNKPHEEKIRRWHELDEWQVEVDWKESLSPDNPRWCKVSHVTTWAITRVYDYEGDLFACEGGSFFTDAEPVSDELAAMLDAEVG
jgi:hypothetical protein